MVKFNLRWGMVLVSLVCVLLVASLQIILSAEFSGVVTEQVWLTTSEGVRLNAKVYKPASGSETMPGIVVCHGFMASHQTMQSRFSLEFAKRGFTVAAIDLPGHGDSEGSMDISIAGMISDAQDFGGDYIVTSSSVLDPSSTDWTIELWMNAESLASERPDAFTTWTAAKSGTGTGRSLVLWQKTTNDWGTFADGTFTAADTSLGKNQWYYLLVTFDDTNDYIHFYLNGTSDSTDKSVTPSSSNGAWVIGTMKDEYKQFFDGRIDEVRISNSKRSTAYIKATYETGRDHLLDFGSEESIADGGWLEGWDKRVKITIDHNDVDSNLSDFPILIHLSSSSGGNNDDDLTFVFDEVGSDSKKIAVTEGDGVAECYVEIEDWDDVNEQAWLWAKIPSINNTSDTVLYLYYDADHIDNTNFVGDTGSTPAENVWDDNFKLVTHMEDDPDTSHIRDSTQNNNDGTKSGAPSTVTSDGMINNAQNFDGIDDHIEVANDTSLDMQDAFTLSAWINAGASTDWQVIMSKEDATEGRRDRNFWLSLWNNGSLTLRFSSSSSITDGDVSDDTDLRDAGWKHVVGVYNGTHCYLYLDGEFQASDPTSNTPQGVGDNLWIGGEIISKTTISKREFDGTIDEVRISNISRSQAWIKASYESEKDHLLDFRAEETEADDGWLEGWDKRVRITIDHNDVDSALSDFPVLVYLSNSSGPNNDDVSFVFDELESAENRRKIAVTTSDGITRCYVEIGKWDDTDEKAWLWVKVPSMSPSEDTDLYLYYDKTHADNTDYVGDTDSVPAENVWDDNFKLVTHMEDDPDAYHVRDSTSNNNDGTKESAGSDEVAGKIGKAQNFKGLVGISKVESNVRAGVDYLLNRTDVDHDKIAVLGHSLGGAMVFLEGYSDPRVKSVVAIAPAFFLLPGLPRIRNSPRNLLLAVGGRDNIVTETSVLSLFRLTTGGGEEIGELYGNFSEGNARKMIVSTGTDHARLMFDPYIAEEAIAWVEASLGIEPSLPISPSPWLDISFPLSVIASLLSVFPVMMCAKELGRLIRKGKPSQKTGPTRTGVKKLVVVYLGAWGCSLLFGMPLSIIRPFSWIPVVFADVFVNAYVIASIILLLFFFVFRRTDEKLELHLLELKTSAVLGTLGFLVFSALNFVFIWTFIDLLPTTEEGFLMIGLFVFLLPLALLDELWLRNIQNRLSDKPWQKMGVPVIVYLLPKVVPLAFASFILGDLVLLASALLFIPALFTAWLFNETGSVTGGTIFNALLYAWVIAVVLPFGTSLWPLL